MHENDLFYQAHEIAYEEGASRAQAWSDRGDRILSRGKLAWAIDRAIRAAVGAFQAEVALLRERLGPDTGQDCALCGERIHGDSVAGEDGPGQRHAHPACYYRRQYDGAQDGLTEVAAALYATGALDQLRSAAEGAARQTVQFEVSPAAAALMLRHLAPVLPRRSHPARR
jgi:hypothetical protein